MTLISQVVGHLSAAPAWLTLGQLVKFLHDLGISAEVRFQNYLDDLAAKGLTRDKPGVR